MAITAQQAHIGAVYVSYFNRSPDPAGLAYWVGQLSSGMSIASIAQSFATQPEAIALYPFLANPSTGGSGLSSFLSSVYSNLFNRAIEQAGLDYWTGVVNGGRPLGRVIEDIISGAQANDRLTVDNKTTVGVE